MAHSRQSSILDFASSIRHESFGRLRRWWRNVREDVDQNPVGWVSHLETPSWSSSSSSSSSAQQLSHRGLTNTATLSMTTTMPTTQSQQHQQDGTDSVVATALSSSSTLSIWSSAVQQQQQQPLSTELVTSSTILSTTSSSSSSSSSSTNHPPQVPLLQHSVSSTFPTGNVSIASNGRLRFGAQSDLSLVAPSKKLATTNSSGSAPLLMAHPPFPPRTSASMLLLTQGFTNVPIGWHPQGDGLDDIVNFPKPKKASTLGVEHQILQCSALLLEMESD